MNGDHLEERHLHSMVAAMGSLGRIPLCLPFVLVAACDRRTEIVGAAAHAMKLLQEKGLSEALRKFARPLLGICLGQQLLFETSDEGDAEGAR